MSVRFDVKWQKGMDFFTGGWIMDSFYGQKQVKMP